MDGTIRLEEKSLPGLKYNPTVWIAEGSSRFETKWKNKQIRWSMLLARLQDATMTQETQAEFFKMSKSQQDEIKDVGGFVGGTLTGGRRKSDTVKDRSMLTFDLDFAPKDFVESMLLDSPYAWAIYSTHKHKTDKPRLRYIVPLDRSVTPEEYEAIARRVADGIGMDYMDSTTFQPSRLMYWPSYSRDAEYVFEYNDEPLLKADDVLATYPDWRDVSYWPICKDEARVDKKRVDKQKDPLTKKGAVGVFCRTYDVPAAIAEFLGDVYTPTDKSDRYTYAKGSTFGGLVIYDDGRFCYSNHGTDPAGGLDLNAFDLVRIHKFGAEDEDAKEGTPSTKLPSYKSMTELVMADKQCRLTLAVERTQEAQDDFKDVNIDDEDGISWQAELSVDRVGRVEPTVDNLVMIFEHDKTLHGIRLNELSGKVELCEPTRWRKDLGEWTNNDDARLYVYISQSYKAKFRRQDITDVLTEISGRRSYHPIKTYLDNLPEWDGTSRVEILLIDYLGATDDIYTREVTKKWMLAAVSRIYQPGIKFDYMPVLSGPEGIGKSTLIAKLGRGWFSDSLSFEDMRDKTAAEKVQGSWINEISELKGMRKMEVESVKSFISRTVDIYRPSYGRVVENHPRGCVFIGTSNTDEYLKDTTGNRRFWPVPVTGLTVRKPWDLTDDDVAQIWAEVMADYELGERELILSKDAEKLAEKRQIVALELDERAGIVFEYLAKELPANWESMDLEDRRYYLDGGTVGADERIKRDGVTVMEIWAECFRKAPADKQRRDSDDIVRILTQLGWVRTDKSKRGIYGVQKVYKKSTES